MKDDKYKLAYASYYFPPHNTVGAFRSSKFCKYSPKNEFEIHVLTTHASPEDKQVIDEYPENVNINRIYEHNYMPETLGWIPSLINHLRKLNENEGLDAIIITASPYLPLAIIPTLSRCVSVKVIIDMRDPWSIKMDYTESLGIIQKGYKKLAESTEKNLLSTSDAFIVDSQHSKQEYINKYGESDISVVRSGFDPNDLEHKQGSRLNDKEQLCYAGKFYEPCEDILKEILDYCSDNSIMFVHIGQKNQKMEDLIYDLGHIDHYHNTGYVKYDKALNYIRGSDIGLAVSRNPTQIPQKLYDYVGCGVPVIGYGPNGSMQDLIEEFNLGLHVNDSENICEAIRKLHSSPKSHSNLNELSIPTRRESSVEFFKVIKKVL